MNHIAIQPAATAHAQRPPYTGWTRTTSPSNGFSAMATAWIGSPLSKGLPRT